jgi:hypothetical protein
MRMLNLTNDKNLKRSEEECDTPDAAFVDNLCDEVGRLLSSIVLAGRSF